MCVVCVCVCMCARARAHAPSPVKRGSRSREHLPKEPNEPWWVQTAPSSHGGCVSGFHTRRKRSAKLSAWSLLAASTCRSSSELALSLPGGCTVLGYVQRSLLPWHQIIRGSILNETDFLPDPSGLSEEAGS